MLVSLILLVIFAKIIMTKIIFNNVKIHKKQEKNSKKFKLFTKID